MSVPVVAVVLAAGFGTRFDPKNPKQLVSVGGKPIVCWSIEAFESNPRVTDIVVVVNPLVRDEVDRLANEHGYPKVRAIIDGGVERVDSTMAALHMLAESGIPGDAKILIHDAVRPFVERHSIDGCIDALDDFTAATVAYASTDTILLTEDYVGAVNNDDVSNVGVANNANAVVDSAVRKVVRRVPERAYTYRAQTPQAFRFDTIRHAYELASADPDFHPTDDTRVVVDYLPNEPVAIVQGSETNLKVTTQSDMPTAERIAEAIQRERIQKDARNRVHAMFGEAFNGIGNN